MLDAGESRAAVGRCLEPFISIRFFEPKIARFGLRRVVVRGIPVVPRRLGDVRRFGKSAGSSHSSHSSSGSAATKVDRKLRRFETRAEPGGRNRAGGEIGPKSEAWLAIAVAHCEGVKREPGLGKTSDGDRPESHRWPECYPKKWPNFNHNNVQIFRQFCGAVFAEIFDEYRQDARYSAIIWL